MSMIGPVQSHYQIKIYSNTKFQILITPSCSTWRHSTAVVNSECDRRNLLLTIIVGCVNNNGHPLFAVAVFVLLWA